MARDFGYPLPLLEQGRDELYQNGLIEPVERNGDPEINRLFELWAQAHGRDPAEVHYTTVLRKYAHPAYGKPTPPTGFEPVSQAREARILDP